MDGTVTIIRRPVRHARLRVREDTSVQLIVPKDFQQAEIDRVLQKKAAWIEQNQQFFRNRAAKACHVTEREILLFNQVFSFVRVRELGHKVVIDEIVQQIRSGRDLSSQADLSRWYRRFARENLAARVRELSAEHRLPYNRLFIRSQRTKWGTCSTKGNISLNWRLILAPKNVRDYVVLHELMHTKVLNHGQRFWVLLRAIFPGCDEAIAWLNANRPPFDLVGTASPS
jgi:predicted metal-dependent hydrolase